MPKGLLLVISEPPAAFEEELNAWYDLDHIPERLAIPGFETAKRFVSADRQRRYLALYDLSSRDVLDSAAYLAFAGENYTPWTKRVISRARFQRVVAEQLLPGDQLITPGSRLLMLRFERADLQMVLETVQELEESDRNVIQVRLFVELGAQPTSHYVLVTGHGHLEALVDLRFLRGSLDYLAEAETFLPY
jgi:hypothetical protein